MKAVKAFGRGVVRARIPILITALLLLIPAVYGMRHTRINYDMLDYLPADMETVIGQNELMEEFGKGAFSFLILEDTPPPSKQRSKRSDTSSPFCGTIPFWIFRCRPRSCPKSSTTPSTRKTRR